MKNWKIKFIGIGGHGAEPHETIDATLIACEFVRNISLFPNVTITSINSGDAFNVISGFATILLSCDNKELIEKVASSLLIFYGETTKYELQEL